MQSKNENKKQSVEKWYYQPSWKLKNISTQQEDSLPLEHLLILGLDTFLDSSTYKAISKLSCKSVTYLSKKRSQLAKDLFPNWEVIQV